MQKVVEGICAQEAMLQTAAAEVKSYRNPPLLLAQPAPPAHTANKMLSLYRSPQHYVNPATAWKVAVLVTDQSKIQGDSNTTASQQSVCKHEDKHEDTKSGQSWGGVGGAPESRL